jgi:hypothetical protein
MESGNVGWCEEGKKGVSVQPSRTTSGEGDLGVEAKAVTPTTPRAMLTPHATTHERARPVEPCPTRTSAAELRAPPLQRRTCCALQE